MIARLRPSGADHLGRRLHARSEVLARYIKAVERDVRRDATDPWLLLSLWAFATLRGNWQRPRLDRLCEERLPYRWLCGGVSVNYHMLSDFRSQGGQRSGMSCSRTLSAVLPGRRPGKMDRVAENERRCVRLPVRIRPRRVGWRNFWKRRGTGRGPQTNGPTKMEQNSRDGSVRA